MNNIDIRVLKEEDFNLILDLSVSNNQISYIESPKECINSPAS